MRRQQDARGAGVRPLDVKPPRRARVEGAARREHMSRRAAPRGDGPEHVARERRHGPAPGLDLRDGIHALNELRHRLIMFVDDARPVRVVAAERSRRVVAAAVRAIGQRELAAVRLVRGEERAPQLRCRGVLCAQVVVHEELGAADR